MFNFKMGNVCSEEGECVCSQHSVREFIYLHQQIDQYKTTVDQLKQTNDLLSKRFEKLVSEYKKFKSEVSQEQRQQRDANASQPKRSNIDKDKINEFVEKMLENSEINVYGFPDAIEKQIYRNIFSMLLNMLESGLDTAEIRLMGHKIQFQIQPISD